MGSAGAWAPAHCAPARTAPACPPATLEYRAPHFTLPGIPPVIFFPLFYKSYKDSEGVIGRQARVRMPGVSRISNISIDLRLSRSLSWLLVSGRPGHRTTRAPMPLAAFSAHALATPAREQKLETGRIFGQFKTMADES